MGFISWIKDDVKHEMQFETEQQGQEIKKDLKQKGAIAIKVEW